ncbi:MAG: PIN domain-containing protein [Halochromatium sp.]
MPYCLLCEPVELCILWHPRARDPDDDRVLETALNGRADHLVTLNTRNFAAAAPFQLAVVEPRALLHQLQEEPV